VTELQEAITASDGLFLAAPEYNRSIPGVLKNTIDRLSRPPGNIQR
jgi:chromate reductase